MFNKFFAFPIKHSLRKLAASLVIGDVLSFVQGYTQQETTGLLDIYETCKKYPKKEGVKTVDAWLSELTDHVTDKPAVLAFLKRLQEDQKEWSCQGTRAAGFLAGKGCSSRLNVLTRKVDYATFTTHLEWLTTQVCSPPAEIDFGNGAVAKIHHYQTADGVALGGYWYEAPKKEAPAVILFHGNGMLAHEMRSIALKYIEEGYSVLIAEYRGCGISQGKRDKISAYRASELDADAAYDFAKYGQNCQVAQGRLVLIHGFSLGAAVAAGLAHRKKEPLVLNHGFDDPVGVIYNGINPAAQKTWWMKVLVNGTKALFWILKPLAKKGLAFKEQCAGAWDTKGKVKELVCQGVYVFVLAGTSDAIISKECVENVILTAGLSPLANELLPGTKFAEYTLTDAEGKEKGHYFLVEGGHKGGRAKENIPAAIKIIARLAYLKAWHQDKAVAFS